MTRIADPMNALVSLQQHVRRGMETNPGEVHPKLRVVFDQPAGTPRFTYAKIELGRVKALSVFVFHEPIDGIRCFNIGYAVPENYAGRGWATEIVEQGIDELRNGLGRGGVKEFYIEAVVATSNLASQRVAEKCFKTPPVQVTDSESGEPALQYTLLVRC